MMIELTYRALHLVPDAAGLQINCRTGSVWVTLDHDSRDIVLEPGQSFATPEHRRALIYALESARVSIDLPGGGSPLHQANLRGWEPQGLSIHPAALSA